VAERLSDADVVFDVVTVEEFVSDGESVTDSDNVSDWVLESNGVCVPVHEVLYEIDELSESVSLGDPVTVSEALPVPVVDWE
jgi:hypothetical protein